MRRIGLRLGIGVIRRRSGIFALRSELLSAARCGLSGGAGMVVHLSAVEHVDDESVLLRGGVMLYPSRSACSALKKQWAAYKGL